MQRRGRAFGRRSVACGPSDLVAAVASIMFRGMLATSRRGPGTRRPVTVSCPTSPAAIWHLAMKNARAAGPGGTMAMLETGTAAPDFTLPDDRGGSFNLKQHRGRPVVLEFYCEDDSGGCVIENQEFSALSPEFETVGATVVAISPQDVASHKKFSAKYGFALPLLADPGLKAIKAYGLWEQKQLRGHEFMGVV